METTTQFWFGDDQRHAVREAHARPSIRISSPARASYLAFRAEPAVMDAIVSALRSSHDEDAPRHLVAERDGVAYKFERHTEFSSLTWIEAAPSGAAPPEATPVDFLPHEAIEVLVLLDIEILDDPDAFGRVLSGAERVLSGVFAGDLRARTTLAPRDDGAIGFHLLGLDQDEEELGRRVQRLIEMETYRTMCLLGLPLARRVSDRLGALEFKLEDISASMHGADISDLAEDEAIFDELSAISAEVGAISAETRFRFGASRAYFDLVRQRLETLDETRVPGVQSITGFALARLNPAMATIESAGRRLETLGEDVARALALLRTRIELNLNRANQALLKSMDDRHRQQVKISEAVESLSTVAITYYGVGLFAYLIGPLVGLPSVDISAELAIALSVPLVFGCVWLILRRARSRWTRRAAGRGDR